MPINIDLTALTNEVTRIEGLVPSVLALLAGQAAAIQKAVDEALAADDAADSGSVEAANAAIASVVERFKAQGDALAAAVTTNPGPDDPSVSRRR